MEIFAVYVLLCIGGAGHMEILYQRNKAKHGKIISRNIETSGGESPDGNINIVGPAVDSPSASLANDKSKPIS